MAVLLFTWAFVAWLAPTLLLLPSKAPEGWARRVLGGGRSSEEQDGGDMQGSGSSQGRQPKPRKGALRPLHALGRGVEQLLRSLRYIAHLPTTQTMRGWPWQRST